MSKPPKKFTPEWIDEDPDVKEFGSKSVDLYGQMKGTEKFDEEESGKTTPHASTDSLKHLLGLFCESIGMDFKGDFAILDLHGLRLADATILVDRCIGSLVEDGRIKKMRIITGKGNHSKGVGILAQEVHPHVTSRFANHLKEISVNPAEILQQNLPYRGFFEIILK